MNDTSGELTRELRDASQAVDDGDGIDLATVKRSAKRIQRRRRGATGAAAAAVLAIAVPVGISVTQTTPDSSPPPWVTETRDPSPTPAPPEQAITVPLAFDGLDSTTIPAGVSYLLRNELHVAGGPTLDLSASTAADGSALPQPPSYLSVAPSRDGFLTAAQNESGDIDVVALDADLAQTDVAPGSDSFAVSQDGSRTAYFVTGPGGAGELRDRFTEGLGESLQEIPGGVQVEPVGYVAGNAVVYQTVEEKSALYVTDFSGTPPQPITGLLHAGGTNEVLDLVAGQVDQREDGSVCSAVLPVDGGPRLWDSCDYDLTRFSPGGQYVIGLPSYRSGFADASVSILDATSGEPYVTLEQEHGTQTAIVEAVWEDDTHLLLTLVDGLDFRIVRLGVDGGYEAVTDPIQGEEGTSPIHFAATP